MSHTVGHINHWHALLFSLVLLLGMDLSCSSILVFRWSWTAPHASLKMAGGGGGGGTDRKLQQNLDRTVNAMAGSTFEKKKKKKKKN